MSGPSERPAVFEKLEQEYALAVERRSARSGFAGRRRRLTLGVAAFSICAVSAAGAAKLLGVSEPVEDRRPLPKSAQPRAHRPVTSTVTEPGTGARWGIRAYTSHAGQACVLAGRVRGDDIGVMLHGRFRPLAPDTVGACGRLLGAGFFFAVQHPQDDLPRSLVIGRVAPRFTSVRLRTPGETRTITVDRDGAFLAVFAGRDLDELDVAVTPVGD